jgi:hypothetical protein
MPIVVSRGKNSTYIPAPAGAHNGVLVDIVDLGPVESVYNGKKKTREMVKLTWELEAVMSDGRRFTISKKYTASLFDKATLYKDLSSWRGKPFTEQELDGFDLDKLLGVPCQLFIIHEEREGKLWAKVSAISKPGAVKLLPSGSYVREQDRADYKPPTRPQAAQAAAPTGAPAEAAAAPTQDDSPLF